MGSKCKPGQASICDACKLQVEASTDYEAFCDYFGNPEQVISTDGKGEVRWHCDHFEAFEKDNPTCSEAREKPCSEKREGE